MVWERARDGTRVELFLQGKVWFWGGNGTSFHFHAPSVPRAGPVELVLGKVGDAHVNVSPRDSVGALDDVQPSLPLSRDFHYVPGC